MQSLYPVAKCATGSLAKVQPLTGNYDVLRDTVRSMTPSNYTNLTIGVAWGVSALTGGRGFETSIPLTRPDRPKIMVVLTDGDNTDSRYTELSQPLVTGGTSGFCASARPPGTCTRKSRAPANWCRSSASSQRRSPPSA